MVISVQCIQYIIVIVKCFERLVMAHIDTIIPDNLCPSERSSEDVISFALHTALSHLDKKDTYVRMLPLSLSLSVTVF
jgi:hypothetical protein